jgi:hypothetical protein
LTRANETLLGQVKEISEKAVAERKALEETLTQKDAQLADVQVKAEESAKTARTQERVNKIMSKLGVTDATKATDLAAKYDSLSDENFDGVLEAHASLTVTRAGVPKGTTGLPAPMAGLPKKVAEVSLIKAMDGAAPVAGAVSTEAPPAVPVPAGEGVSALQSQVHQYLSRAKPAKAAKKE